MGFKCASCNQWHDNIPGWGWRIPYQYQLIPEAERMDRCYLTTDLCVVDDKHFLITGLLEIPVLGIGDSVSLRVWVSVGRSDWFEYQDLIGRKQRSQFGPYQGLMDSTIPTYPDTFELPVSLKVQDNGIRPAINVQRCDNPIYYEQKNGMTKDRLVHFYEFFGHDEGDA